MESEKRRGKNKPTAKRERRLTTTEKKQRKKTQSGTQIGKCRKQKQHKCSSLGGGGGGWRMRIATAARALCRVRDLLHDDARHLATQLVWLVECKSAWVCGTHSNAEAPFFAAVFFFLQVLYTFFFVGFLDLGSTGHLIGLQ